MYRERERERERERDRRSAPTARYYDLQLRSPLLASRAFGTPKDTGVLE